MTRETETTEVGEQTLMDGVRPDRLRLMAASPMTPKRNPNAPQKQCDHGLFDEVGRAQIDLTDLIAQSNKET
ncbi:MAG: hypothetical protein ACRBEQ_14410 [Hyphomonas sp.]